MKTARTRAELEPLDHHVYIAWRGDECLYVGMTADPDTRLAFWEKQGRSGWYPEATHVDVWHIGPGRTRAYDVEREAIVALDPSHNLQFSPRVDRDKQAWHDYCRWSEALQTCTTFTDRQWAVDQELADRLCAAVGRKAPDVKAYVEADRAYMHNIIASIGSPLPTERAS